ncbi:MAG: acyltransferase [Desulfobacteraceae bacterium]|nr:MAG: acyltransferase [Desulfobacteraceae bacterium]
MKPNILSSSVIGGLTLLLFGLNTVWWTSVLYIFAFIKLLIPHAGIRHQISRLLILIAMVWIEGNSFIIRMTQRIKWDVQGLEHLAAERSYLVVSNHRSWADIFVLQHIFKQRIPFLKFFLKQELIWVPFLGIAWWALDFPFLKRYSRSFLKKHPELRGKDMETTRKHCEKFKNQTVSVMNFLEGTRFNYQKHKKQNSPYRHLLSPKAGGVTLIFSCMGDYLSNVVDVTIVYPQNEPPVHFWDLLAGKVPCITVRVTILPVPGDVVGADYEEDKAFRERMHQWVNQLWQAKDQLIEDLLAEKKCGWHNR